MLDTSPLVDSGSALLNRHQRRALTAAGYYRERNGMSHDRLTLPAYNLLVSQFASHDNILSTGHQAALMALVGLMTEMARIEAAGRLWPREREGRPKRGERVKIGPYLRDHSRHWRDWFAQPQREFRM
jgi:hypothetical protein